MQPPRKRTKLQMLYAVFDRFHESLREVPGEVAARFVANWTDNKGVYLSPPEGVKPSQLAAGLEQGLLELPMRISAFGAASRGAVSEALHSAIEAEYPMFLEKEEARLSKIRTRGRISSESEFNLVRHAVDIAESQEASSYSLPELYQLIETFEARGRRGA